MVQVSGGGWFAVKNVKTTSLVHWYLTDGVQYRLTDENGRRLYIIAESQRPNDVREPLIP